MPAAEPALAELEGDLKRMEAVLRAKRSGREYPRLDERYRQDPDVALTAVADWPEALLSAPKRLRCDPGFAVEAVGKNWRALEHLDSEVRSDSAVLRAALRSASRGGEGNLARKQFGGMVDKVDKGLADEARVLGQLGGWIRSYEGECLRLVGVCNEWRTTDSLLRLRRCRLGASSGWSGVQACRSGGQSAGSEARPPRAPPGPTGVQDIKRHQLTVHLRSGYLSFQVLSCTQGYDFRIFPLTCDRFGYFLLTPGEPDKMDAGVGGEKDGHHRNFFIEEARGTVVTIFVELLLGFAVSWEPPGPEFFPIGVNAGAPRRAAAVWYVIESKASVKEGGLLSLGQKFESTNPFVEQPAPMAHGINLARLRIMEDVDVRKEELEDLVWQALSISRSTFDVAEAEMLSLFSDDAHLTLLADEGGQTTLGYCHYFLYTEKGALYFWIEFIVVAESYRGKNCGKELMRWALAFAEDAGCRAVRLQSRDSKMEWYRSLGFEAMDDPTEKKLWPMQLLLPRRGWGKG